MDYFIVVVTTVAGLYFHGWLYVRMRRWMDRDLACHWQAKTRRSGHSCSSCWSGRGQKRSNAALAAWLEREAAAFKG
jgi:hypothetical protein